MTPWGLGWAMCVESRRARWAVLWVAVALFATGCATLPPSSGEGDAYGPAEVPREARAPHGSLSCGGQAVPEGWPDYSSWWDEELLAPFFQCTSPGEFLALQRRVDMPRLVEALEDWSAVRLGALGPMEARAARVLQRKRLSFLVTATRKYGAYAQVLILFLVDTTFDDEVRELLLLLARDKQLEQTLGQMEVVREALLRRGFTLSDYPDRDEQLRDVVRGLGRAAADVASTIPVVVGARGGGVFAVRAHLPLPYQETFDATERALTREHWAPGHVALGAFDSLTFGVPLGFYYLAEGTGHGGTSLYHGRYEQAARELAPAALLVGLYAGGKGVRSLSEAKGVAGIGEKGGRLQLPELRLPVLKEVVDRLRERLGEDGLGRLARLIQGRREVAVMVADGGEPVAVAIYESRGDLARAHVVLSQARPELRGSTRPMAGAGKGPGGAASAVDEAAVTTPKSAGSRSALGGEAIAHWRVRRVLEQIREKASAGTFRRAGNYHAHFSEARVLEILRSPDAIYESSGRAGKLIYHQGGDIVVVEGPGSGQGQVITGYGPSGIRAESGVRALGGEPTDLGTPITPEMMTGGTIPVPPNRPRIPAATQIWPPPGDSHE